MEIRSIARFIRYFQSIRNRTARVISEIPSGLINWSPSPDSFSFADIIRHIAAIEYNMFGRNIQNKKSTYPGHNEELAESHDEIIQYFELQHQKMIELLQEFDDNDLQKKIKTPAGAEITLWKWLRAMVEHEIHHRGQIYTYLRLIETQTTPLYGLTSEEVKARSDPLFSEEP